MDSWAKILQKLVLCIMEQELEPEIGSWILDCFNFWNLAAQNLQIAYNAEETLKAAWKHFEEMYAS